jgi:hypothetical protein
MELLAPFKRQRDVKHGVDLYIVGAVLGHTDSRSAQRYAHLATESLSVAIGKIGQKIPNTPKRKAA